MRHQYIHSPHCVAESYAPVEQYTHQCLHAQVDQAVLYGREGAHRHRRPRFAWEYAALVLTHALARLLRNGGRDAAGALTPIHWSCVFAKPVGKI